MDSSRFMTSYELRGTIEQKDRQISQLKQQVTILQKENETLKGWNSRWQKYVWSEQLALQCKSVHKEVKGLSYIQAELLKYIAGLLHNNSERHVRAIARELHIPVSTASTNLSLLQKKGLIRGYYRGTKFKRYYALKESLLFLDSNCSDCSIVSSSLSPPSD